MKRKGIELFTFIGKSFDFRSIILTHLLEIVGLEHLPSHNSYKSMNEKNEKWIKIVRVLCTPVSVSIFVVPLLFHTTVLYYTKGLEEEDYYLPFPMW